MELSGVSALAAECKVPSAPNDGASGWQFGGGAELWRLAVFVCDWV